MKTVFYALVATFATSASAFAPATGSFFGVRTTNPPLAMVNIAEGVEFDTIAREWRCKWSKDADMASLVAAQKALEAVLDDVKAVDGVKSVERIVCGVCLDLKVVTSVSADKFEDWEGKDFSPESDFLAMLNDIDGISAIETQTYTKMPV